jgi:GH15 family glucan-1,4-alpha-glucosidase
MSYLPCAEQESRSDGYAPIADYGLIGDSHTVVGNFPQTLTHLSHIEAALALREAESAVEQTG